MDGITLVIFLFYLTGLFFNLAGVVGILRLPDIYCRLHSSSKNTTLGTLLIVFGLVLREFQAGAGPAGVKVLAIAFMMLVITPIGSHALARSAYKNGAPLAEETVCDQYLESFKEESTAHV